MCVWYVVASRYGHVWRTTSILRGTVIRTTYIREQRASCRGMEMKMFTQWLRSSEHPPSGIQCGPLVRWRSQHSVVNTYYCMSIFFSIKGMNYIFNMKVHISTKNLKIESPVLMGNWVSDAMPLIGWILTYTDLRNPAREVPNWYYHYNRRV